MDHILTTENIELKFYLPRLILSMKNKTCLSLRYYITNIPVLMNTITTLHTKKIFGQSNFCVEKGFILGFKEEREGENIAKVKIHYNCLILYYYNFTYPRKSVH